MIPSVGSLGEQQANLTDREEEAHDTLWENQPGILPPKQVIFSLKDTHPIFINSFITKTLIYRN